MPLNWQIATVYYGVIDLVAGVGVWLLSPWGVVVWIIRTLSQFTMHTFFAATYGTRPYELTYYLVTIILFVVLRHYAIKEKKFTLQLGLGLTR